MNDMEKAVLDLIREHYKCEYNGGLKVTKLGRGWAGYKLTLYLGNPDAQKLELSADLEAEDFLKFIEKELISRLLLRTKYFRGIKIYPEDEKRETCCKN